MSKIKVHCNCGCGKVVDMSIDKLIAMAFQHPSQVVTIEHPETHEQIVAPLIVIAMTAIEAIAMIEEEGNNDKN